MAAERPAARRPTRIMLDTNVLVAASDPTRSVHRAATDVLNEWSRHGTVLHASSQVIREYLVVATRPASVNGLGLSTEDALRNVAAFRGRVEVLAEASGSVDRLLELIRTTACSGKQVHDANIVATMLTYGVRSLVTDNVKDFTRFGDEIEVVELQ